MKYLLILLFLPLTSFAQSNQQMLTGTWVKVKAQMRDGSRIVDHNGCGMDFLKYNFTPEGMANRSSEPLFDGFKLPYKLLGDSLVVGGTIYNVLGLTKDTLKLSFFALGAEDNQVPVFYFTKVLERNIAGPATFNVALKDSVYQANSEFFPQCKGDILTLMRAITTDYDKGTLKASFTIDKKGRVKNYTIISTDSISNGFAKTICRGFEDVTWQPALKNHVPAACIVQVTFKNKRSLYSGTAMMMNNLQMEYDFLPKAPYPVIDRDEFATSQQFLKDAINQSNSGNYDKAIELLTKCIEIDNINLSAYNFRAFINANRGKTKEACKDWATLAAYGQLDGAKKLAKFCKN
jgi:tetratricopeptide (TPR) repeat protein